MKFGIKVNGNFAKLGNLNTQAKISSSEVIEKKDTSKLNFADNSQQKIDGNNNFSEEILNIPSIIIPPSILKENIFNTSKKTDLLSLTDKLPNGTFDIISSLGISKIRPEIISLVKFLPVYKNIKKNVNKFNDNLTPAGELFTIQLWARKLISDQISNLISILKQDPNLEKVLNERENNFISQIEEARQDVLFLYQLLIDLENLKNSFDISKISDENQTEKVLKKLFTEQLGFGETNFHIFSNTKLLLQLMFDLRFLLKFYSYNLIGDISNTKRLDDQNLLNVNKNLPFSFIFALENFSSNGVPILATDITVQQTFLNALPPDPDDRIKLLTVLLSKEFRVSAFLGDSHIGKWDREVVVKNYPQISNTGDPFDSIVGNVGTNIIDTNNEENTLTDIMKVFVDNNTTVLPFEQKFILTNSSEKNYIPGSDYFIDPILGGKKRFDLTSLENYCSNLNSKVQNFTNAIKSILQLKVENVKSESFKGFKIFDEIITSFQEVLKNLSSKKISDKHAFFIALFDAAHKDLQLKNLLFQYIIAVALSRDQEKVGAFVKNISEAEVSSKTIASKFPLISSFNQSEPFAGIAYAIASRLSELYPAKGLVLSPLKTTVISGDNVLELMSSVLVSNANSSQNSLSNDLPVVGQIIQSIDKLENEGNKFGVRLKDGTNRTRKTSLSVSFVAMMFLEIYTALCNKYSFTKFSGLNNDNEFIISTDYENNFKIKLAIASMPKGPFQFSYNNEIGATKLDFSNISLNSVFEKIINDDILISGIVQTIANINEGIQSNFQNIKNKLNPNSNSLLSKRLNSISSIVGSEEILSEITKYQIILDKVELDNIDNKLSNKEDNAAFLLGKDSFSVSQENIILDFLNKPNFVGERGAQIKIISVGIPTGFIKKLHEQNDVLDVKNLQNSDKENDIIKINVYKIDQQYDDIIFKPKQFIFELSRFVSKSKTFSINSNLSSNSFEGFTTKDYSFRSKISNQNTSVFNNSLDEEMYSFLTDIQKNQLIQNHLTSYILEVYIRLLTGVSITEKNFAVNIGDLIDKKFENNAFMKNIVNQYFSKITGNKINIDDFSKDFFSADIKQVFPSTSISGNQKLLAFENVPKSIKTKLTEDIKTFMKLFSSNTLLSDGLLEKTKLISPCIFERIFHIPINSQEFEIDVDLTNETISGKSCLSNLIKQGIVIEPEEEKKEFDNSLLSSIGKFAQFNKTNILANNNIETPKKLMPFSILNIGKSKNYSGPSLKIKNRPDDVVIEKFFITIESL